MRFLLISLFFSQFLIGQNIESHVWKERVIIISGSMGDREMVQKQFNQLRYKAKELSDRKLIIYKCLENTCTIYDSKAQPRQVKTKQKFNEFNLSLIGLDGHQKFKSNTIENSDLLFKRIDRMPMRQEELKSTRNE